VRVSLRKLLLWPWIQDLRAEKSELAARVQHLQKLLEEVRIPPMLVTTMPKSGTHYISKLLTQGLFIECRSVSHMYFPYDVIRQPELRVLAKGNAVNQDHFGASKINLVHISKHVDRMVVHLRDPRQALLSYVHYLSRPHFRRSEEETLLFIYPPMPDDFYQLDLEARIDWAIENWLPLLVEWTEEWVAAADTMDRPLIKFTRYEDLVADPDRFVRDVLQFFRIPVERYVPPRIEQDEEVLFRKGEVAEWMTTFTPKQAAAASAKIPSALAVQFGWTLEGIPSASIR
jgi:Sulfotransferase domain